MSRKAAGTALMLGHQLALAQARSLAKQWVADEARAVQAEINGDLEDLRSELRETRSQLARTLRDLASAYDKIARLHERARLNTADRRAGGETPLPALDDGHSHHDGNGRALWPRHRSMTN